MVKPPKTMQPEAVNLEKAGRDSGKAFQDDSHHNYMARKIDLQRKQFGLVVPPDPRTLEGTVANERPRKAVAEVHFAPDVQDPSEKKAKKRKRKKIGLDSVLRRLKRRHGKVKGSSKSFTKLKEDVTQSSHAKTDPPPQAASHPQSHSKAEPDAKTLHQLETRPAMDKVGNHKYSPTKQARPDLFFTGVFILVNGYTNPDTETLQRLMHKHGGDLDKYETSRVTHIIAEHLSTAKANIYKRQKKPTPVCNPNWVVDCVRAQRLLPHAEYLIKEVRGGDIGIATYFEDDYASDSIDHHNTLVSSFQEQVGDCLKIPPSSPPRWEPIKSDAKTDKIDTVANAVVSPVRRATSSSTDTPSAPIEDQNAVSLAQKLSSPSSRTDEKCIDGRIRTTGTDPNFLESFFDQSRLSFIGSYKQRARQTTQKKVSRRKGDHRFVFHVDMDCFFASVVLRSFPEYRDRPVAISHQGKKRLVDGSTKVSPVFFKGSTSECATCNYTARGFGVKKGMYLGRAKELCPDLVVLQYDFEGYEEVSEQVTDILYQHAEDWHGVIEQVSCDEAYMEIYVAGDSGRRPEDVASELAENIRKGVFDATQCTATVGVAPNRLLAKLATDRVKPNRSFVVDDYRELIRDLHLRNLHGIGHRSEKKLVNEGLVTVQDIWDLDKQAEGELCRILGTGLGKKILDACYGRDERPVEAAERKTIGAECNYGVRFNGLYGVDHMLEGLAQEVARRMESVAVRGTKVTLKVKQRKSGAPPPPKFLGHGSCYNLSRSLDTPDGSATRDWKVMYRLCTTLYTELNVPKEDIRGMGVTVRKLVSDDTHMVDPKDSKQCIKKLFSGKFHLHRQSDDSTAVLADTEDDGDVRLFYAEQRVEREHDTDEGIVEVSVAKTFHQGGDDIPITDDSEMRIDEAVSLVISIEDDPVDDIKLPPFSQIRMSQVEALPSPWRKQIQTKIESDRAVAANRAKEAASRRTGNRSSPVARGSGPTYKDTRFRQTDVKRMMRLAAVKSGQESLLGDAGAPVSLTQLDNLPLEMQLQIANDDEHLVGNLLTGKSYDDSNDHKKAWKPRIRGTTETRDRTTTKPALEALKTEEKALTVPLIPIQVVRTDPSAFFREYHMPLAVFLDENPTADREAVSFVIQFLCLCAEESGLDFVVRLLRATKNRGDGWSREPLTSIMQAVNEKVHQLHAGARLDDEWLFSS